MFNFFKKRREEEEKKKSTLDKIVMGAIIGTAIGSVIGLTMAPKKGKETRGFLKSLMRNKPNDRPHDTIKKIPHEPRAHEEAPIQRNTLEDLTP